VSALLSPVAEMLMWCFNPAQMLEIQKRLDADPTLRSAEVQKSRCWAFTLQGFAAPADDRMATSRIAAEFDGPGAGAYDPGAQCGAGGQSGTAFRPGLDNAALPDDYRDIAALLRMEPDKGGGAGQGRPCPSLKLKAGYSFPCCAGITPVWG